MAATRPHYGGTLRVAMQSAPNTLELPAYSSPAGYWDMARVLSLIGDTLVKTDAQGRPQPALAAAWQCDSTAHRCQFTLQRGVKFHDGTPASAAAVAQILGVLHPEWIVRAAGGTAGADSLTIDSLTAGALNISALNVSALTGAESSAPSLLAELALPRNLILTHNATGLPIGTGPFYIADFQPAKSLKLTASEDCWSGRPFVDQVGIEFGKSLRDQALALDLGRADIVEAAPQAANTSPRIQTTLPIELMALVFPANSKAQDIHLRQALALSIDRKPIQTVLLKGAAEAAGSILPNWMTGYSAAFSTQPDLQRAKALLAESRQPALTLSYDARDPQAQLIAERIALNAREAGITLLVSLSGTEDLQLVRIALPSADAALTLRETGRQLGLSQPILHSNTVEDLYQAEQTLLDGSKVIPLFHLPVASASGARVRRHFSDPLGAWNLQEIWLENSR